MQCESLASDFMVVTRKLNQKLIQFVSKYFEKETKSCFGS